MTVTTSDTGSERPLVLIQTNQEEVFPGSSKVERAAVNRLMRVRFLPGEHGGVAKTVRHQSAKLTCTSSILVSASSTKIGIS